MNSVTFFSDEPIKDESQDKLKRANLAHNIALGIKNWQHSQTSLVVAIYGEWGSGKTSLKNLVFGNLKETCELVTFNPWTYSDEMTLRQAFLDELTKSVWKVDPTVDKRTSRDFWCWSKVVTVSGKAIEVGGNIGSWVHPLAGKGAEVLGKSLAGLGEAAKESAKPDDAQSAELMESLKTRLSEELSKLAKPIVVAVDDIDRLSAQEIRALFQLIKANGDFPNLAFLVLCHQELVEESLAELLPATMAKNRYVGAQYLNKIVHASVNVPSMKPERSAELLFERVSGVVPAVLNYDLQLLHSACLAICTMLETFRHVIRLHSSFSFQVGMYSQDKETFIDPADLLILECIRLYKPQLFIEIVRERRGLCSTRNTNFENEAHQALNRVIDIEAADKQYFKWLIPMVFTASKHISQKGDPAYKPHVLVAHESPHRLHHLQVFEDYLDFVRPKLMVEPPPELDAGETDQ